MCWNIIVVFISISWLWSCTFFIYLLAINMSCLGNNCSVCLSTPYCDIRFCYQAVGILNILRINPFIRCMIHQYFSHSQTAFFICWLYLLMCRSFQFDVVLFISFMLHFRCHSHKIIAKVSWRLYTHILFLTLFHSISL